MSIIKTALKNSITSISKMNINPRFNRLPPIPTISDIIRIYKLSARKQLAQNFILDQNICDKFVSQCHIKENSIVAEIGPGPGGITRSILKRNIKRMVLVEKDTRFSPWLRILSESTNIPVEIILHDILQCNFENILKLDTHLPHSEKNWNILPNAHICGNLPFNISTPLLINIISQIAKREHLWSTYRVPFTFTFQKEVCDRIVSLPKNSNRSRLSLICQIYCHVTSVCDLPRTVFVPEPKVDVGTVRFVPRIEPLNKLPFPTIQKILSKLFMHKRKHLLFNLKTFFPKDENHIAESILIDCKVEPKKTVEHMNMYQFNEICSRLMNEKSVVL